jgi:serine O-acetyltransferase
MKTAIRTYLRKGFDGLFTAYQEEWLDLAAAMAEEARALILSDVALKYPHITDAPDADAALAPILDTDSTIVGTVLYRLSHALFLREPKHPALAYLAQFMKVRTGMEIYYSTAIGPRFRVEHGTGLVIGPRNRIGADFIVHQGVTFGQRRTFSPHETITVGDGCIVFAGAKLLGHLTIGHRVKIAANAVLLANAEDDSTYAGMPAKKMRG